MNTNRFVHRSHSWSSARFASLGWRVGAVAAAAAVAAACSSDAAAPAGGNSGPTFGNPEQATTEDSPRNDDTEPNPNAPPATPGTATEGSSAADNAPAAIVEGTEDVSLDNSQADPQQADPASGNEAEVAVSDEASESAEQPTDPEPPPEADPVGEQGRLLVPPTQGTPNLFTEVLGVTEREVDEKLILAVNRIFGIGTDESTTPVVDEGFRLFYELPQDPSMAFIWAPDSADIRSEGMSYGMMLAVQMDMQEQFDKLWKFSRTFMEFDGVNDPWRFYLSWNGRVDTSNANNWNVIYTGDGPAPDGEEYFAAALYLADRRWGSNGGVNYEQDADNLSNAMLNNPSGNGRTPVVDAGSNMIVFYPSGGAANFSDPSYHLPAFYELFAQDGAQTNAARWRQMANISRQYFVDSADNNTGLHPDYANFDGSPTQNQDNHDEFRYDAWRVIMNMAVDYAWGSNDARLTQQVDKYYDFFGTRLDGANVSNALFALDGSNPDGGGSTALTSTLGTGAMATNHANRRQFVENAWNVGQQSGQYRYYQELVYALGLLASGGMYGYQWQ